MSVSTRNMQDLTHLAREAMRWPGASDRLVASIVTVALIDLGVVIEEDKSKIVDQHKVRNLLRENTDFASIPFPHTICRASDSGNNWCKCKMRGSRKATGDVACPIFWPKSNAEGQHEARYGGDDFPGHSMMMLFSHLRSFAFAMIFFSFLYVIFHRLWLF